MRKDRLYKQYADEQLARIITALIREDTISNADIEEVPIEDI